MASTYFLRFPPILNNNALFDSLLLSIKFTFMLVNKLDGKQLQSSRIQKRKSMQFAKIFSFFVSREISELSGSIIFSF